MITADEQRSWFQQLITQTDVDMPGKNQAWIVRARDAAKQAMAELPVPDRKQEAWRYTSIESLLKHH